MIHFDVNKARRLLTRFRDVIYQEQPDHNDIVAAAATLIRDCGNQSAANLAERNMYIEEVVSTLREQP